MTWQEQTFRVTDSANSWVAESRNRRLVSPTFIKQLHTMLHNCGIDAHDRVVIQILPGNSELTLQKVRMIDKDFFDNLDNEPKVG